METINKFTYDPFLYGNEREKNFSLDKETDFLRQKVFDNARQRMFLEMDTDPNRNGTRRASEKALFYYVSTGNIVKIAEIMQQGSDGATSDRETMPPAGDISENAILQALSIFISGVTLCTRAAVDGGLPELVAYTLSDCYINAALDLKDSKKIMNLISCVVYDFTYEVYNYKFRNCTPLVKKCCEYICRHLHDEITLSTLSELTGKSANYISDSFMKDLGVRPTLYIRKLKLDYAKHVLDAAEFSVAAISDLLAFPSTSSFISYFKEEFGVTPLQYKKKT